MTLGERIKELRKTLNLTQQEFCIRIGLKRNSISLVESGKRNISEQAILSICREFNVNKKWLDTGEGEMFNSASNNVLDMLTQKYDLDSFGRTVIEKMVHLNNNQWKELQKFATKLFADLSLNASISEQTIEEKVEAYRQKLLQESESTCVKPAENSDELPSTVIVAELTAQLATLKQENQQLQRQHEADQQQIQRLEQMDDRIKALEEEAKREDAQAAKFNTQSLNLSSLILDSSKP